VLHELADAFREADRVLVLAHGRSEEMPPGDPLRVAKLAQAFSVPEEKIVL
jgi:hypothetical protein